jgi:hypothetical protein
LAAPLLHRLATSSEEELLHHKTYKIQLTGKGLLSKIKIKLIKSLNELVTAGFSNTHWISQAHLALSFIGSVLESLKKLYTLFPKTEAAKESKKEEEAASQKAKKKEPEEKKPVESKPKKASSAKKPKAPAKEK